MDASDAIPGYRATVHQGPLEPLTIWYAPHEYAVLNILLAMFMMLMVTWRWAPIAAAIHGGLVVCWLIDPHLLPSLLRSLRYLHYLGPS